jgi:hypothetical protein
VQQQLRLILKCGVQSSAQHKRTRPPKRPVHNVRVANREVQQLKSARLFQRPVHVPGDVAVDQGQGGFSAKVLIDIWKSIAWLKLIDSPEE